MTITKYAVGFILSLMLTIVAYDLVVFRSMSSWVLAALAVLAIAQMIVQLVFFLHLGDELRPRYKLASLLFMTVILLIIVVGSVWIMNNLNYNMMQMTPTEKTNYMMTQHDKGF